MRRGLPALLAGVLLAAVASGCTSGQDHSTRPAATRSASPMSSSSATGRPSSPAAPGSSRSPSGPAVPTAAIGTGITGQTVIVNCPVDRGEPPCPAVPVQARLAVLDSTARSLVATVDTDRQGHFSVALVAGDYLIRPVLIAGGPARRPNNLAVTVAAGQYTTITMRLDNLVR